MAVRVQIAGSEDSFLLPDNFEEQKLDLKAIIDATFSQEALIGDVIAEEDKPLTQEQTPETPTPTVSDLVEGEELPPGAPVSPPEKTSTKPAGFAEGTTELFPVLNSDGSQQKTTEGRPVYKSQSGDHITERTITENIPQLGGWINLPTVYDGRIVDVDEAVNRVIEAEGKDPVTGKELPTFKSLEEAVAFAEGRTEGLGKELTETGDTPPGEFSDEDLENLFDGDLTEQEPGVTMADNFDSIVDEVIGEEGGYTNNPRDKGGPTNFGIALNFNKAALAELGITDAEGVKNMTRDQAKDIYREQYWKTSQAPMLPEEVQFDYFTAYINSPKRAVKAMQNAVGTAADGIIGPKTIEAIRSASAEDTNLGERIKFEYAKSLAENAKDWDAFGNGWANRYLETNEFGRSKINIAAMERDEAVKEIEKFEPTKS